MNKIEYESIVNNYNELLKEAYKIASKWGEIYIGGDSFGYYVGDLKIINNKISFIYRHYDGIFPLYRNEIPLDFLFDDSGIEEHAKKQLKIDFNEKQKIIEVLQHGIVEIGGTRLSL
jgi:hypothetical protein